MRHLFNCLSLSLTEPLSLLEAAELSQPQWLSFAQRYTSVHDLKPQIHSSLWKGMITMHFVPTSHFGNQKDPLAVLLGSLESLRMAHRYSSTVIGQCFSKT